MLFNSLCVVIYTAAKICQNREEKDAFKIVIHFKDFRKLKKCSWNSMKIYLFTSKYTEHSKSYFFKVSNQTTKHTWEWMVQLSITFLINIYIIWYQTTVFWLFWCLNKIEYAQLKKKFMASRSQLRKLPLKGRFSVLRSQKDV